MAQRIAGLVRKFPFFYALETLLVFNTKQSMIVSMDKSWYHKFFSPSQKPDEQVAEAKPDYEDADVQFRMGLKFANVQGATQDYVQAAEWYRKAAGQSHCLAQFNLGVMYSKGQGMTKDDALSMMWFGKAANQGDAGAQFNLGKSCQRASFVALPEAAVESRIEAYKWFHLAAAQGYMGSDGSFITLLPKMTMKDVADGDRRVAAFGVKQPEQSQV